MKPRRTLALAGLAVALATVAGAPPEAVAARQTIKKGFWDFNGRSDFRTMRRLGAGVYSTRLYWNSVAIRRPIDPTNPNDPGFRWPDAVTEGIAQARRHGMRVAVEVRNTVGWARPPGTPPHWLPIRVEDYADFITAASRRYPEVRYWIIWSEPTRQASLLPLIPQIAPDVPLDEARSGTPRYYARLLDAAYGAIKLVDRKDVVVGGNTFIGGDISPLNWIRALKLPNGRAPRMDLYGHHPFGERRPDLSEPNVRKGLADFSDLDTLARWIDRYIGRDRQGRKLKLWLGELCYPTDHPNRNHNSWVTRATQASWLRQALKITRRWKRIKSLVWIGLYDPPPLPTGDETNCGLLDWQGHPKPSYKVFIRG